MDSDFRVSSKNGNSDLVENTKNIPQIADVCIVDFGVNEDDDHDLFLESRKQFQNILCQIERPIIFVVLLGGGQWTLCSGGGEGSKLCPKRVIL